MKLKLFRWISAGIIAMAAAFTLYASAGIDATTQEPLFGEIMESYNADTGAQNAVASVYLNYRVFDTVFEALMLLVSVMGVVHFSRHEHKTVAVTLNPTATRGFILLMVPGIIMLGCYIILNGHNTPGGGFQGGAALASTLICVYLAVPEKTINFEKYEMAEKILFLVIIMVCTVFAVTGMYLDYDNRINIAYLMLMNVLIGAKVFCGLSIVFFRFVHYEDK